MPKIRAASEIAKKWATVTPARQADYTTGVSAPLRDWKSNTKAAESSYEQGVSEAIARKAFGKGVEEAGTEKWQRKAVEVGVGRWGPGVRAAEEDYNSGFTPFRDVIERTTLPPRYPKGSPQNIDRVATLARELHAAKTK